MSDRISSITVLCLVVHKLGSSYKKAKCKHLRVPSLWRVVRAVNGYPSGTLVDSLDLESRTGKILSEGALSYLGAQTIKVPVSDYIKKNLDLAVLSTFAVSRPSVNIFKWG